MYGAVKGVEAGKIDRRVRGERRDLGGDFRGRGARAAPGPWVPAFAGTTRDGPLILQEEPRVTTGRHCRAGRARPAGCGFHCVKDTIQLGRIVGIGACLV